ncbi:MAG: hypothetical protein ABI446_12795 [Gemmatimonadaceae bacterium]
MQFSTMKRPSAWLPVAMSALALAIVLGHVLINGAAREADEGTVAHLFQLLMVAQLPIILVFAIRWLPVNRRAALSTLALQAGAALLAILPVLLLGL